MARPFLSWVAGADVAIGSAGGGPRRRAHAQNPEEQHFEAMYMHYVRLSFILQGQDRWHGWVGSPKALAHARLQTGSGAARMAAAGGTVLLYKSARMRDTRSFCGRHRDPGSRIIYLSVIITSQRGVLTDDQRPRCYVYRDQIEQAGTSRTGSTARGD